MAETNQRNAYGATLVELCSKNPNILVLDADLGGSTMGKMVEQALPQQHIEMGIAEANMVSVAGGLASVGKIPFVNSFAVFATGRALDQIRQSISIGQLNVKICGSSAGCSDFGDGATHQAFEDIALMRVIPGMTVIVPADANEAAAATRFMASTPGPMYIRLNRNSYQNVTEERAEFRFNDPFIVREGTDVVVFACGIMTVKALEAAVRLSGRLSVRVVNVSTIKPLNREKVLALCSGVKGVVTAEEHSIIGGLGSAIAEALRRTRLPIEFVGVNDTFGSSAHSYSELMDYLGLTAVRIAEAVESVCNEN